MKEEENGMDAYLTARAYEREAREQEKRGHLEAAIEQWKQYAEVKESKGSYFLCIFGYFNAARLFDRLGRWKDAAECFEAASRFAEKVGEFSLWVFFKNLTCQMYEKAGDYEACANCYESIGNFFSAMHNFFGAADAYEHAAEIMMLSGKDISDYKAPMEAWRKNYEYWCSRGEQDDAEWSLKRMSSYRATQNGT
jgi:tetratricopeptide (TPR) repeat protein